MLRQKFSHAFGHAARVGDLHQVRDVQDDERLNVQDGLCHAFMSTSLKSPTVVEMLKSLFTLKGKP